MPAVLLRSQLSVFLFSALLLADLSVLLLAALLLAWLPVLLLTSFLRLSLRLFANTARLLTSRLGPTVSPRSHFRTGDERGSLR